MGFEMRKFSLTASITLLLVVIIVSTVGCSPPPPPHRPKPVAPPTPAPAPAPTPVPAARNAIVAMQWPMGLCKTSHCKKQQIIPGDRFTLHGVWPVRADGSEISYCPGAEKFSYSALKKLMPLITYVWPSFQMDEKDFWRHEWERHGTCAELEFSEYFERSLKLAKQYTSLLYNTLAHAQKPIKPSPLTDMTQAPRARDYFDSIFGSLNLAPRIKCTTTPDSKVYLLEIQLCAEFDLKNVKNCSAAISSSSFIGCGKYGLVAKNKALYYLDPKKNLI